MGKLVALCRHKSASKICAQQVYCFSSVPQNTAAIQCCTSRLELVASLLVAVQANCAPCLALSGSVCQKPHDGFGLELRTPANLSSVESCMLQGLCIAHLGCLVIPINSLVVATDCIKTHQDPKEHLALAADRTQEQKCSYVSPKTCTINMHMTSSLPQGSKRDAPGRTRQSRQLPARSCLQESCGLLRMQDAHASFYNTCCSLPGKTSF